MSDHRGQAFSTPDEDNDNYYYYHHHCAAHHNAGFWYNGCYTANLNGRYGRNDEFGVALYQRDDYTRQLNLQYTQMKIRPVQEI
ncbi:Tenascin [Holothuria leucospilota]|uniref:Tenascin n=1 Tax=Holothuria leucospilota TaxID=206669 RepID=A0A9Q1BZS7_HOLLE|nr:Tenascin [Holothuria leucospilota]